MKASNDQNHMELKLEDQMDRPQGSVRTEPRSVFSNLYYGFRIYLHKKRWLLRYSQIIRGWWILGPFRQYAVRYFQQHKHNPPLQVDRRDIFPQMDVNKVVDALNAHGYANGMVVPSEYVSQILQYCETTKLLKYWNPHKECGAIDLLARNAKIVEVARRYLGAEPILWLTQLRWSFGDVAQQQEILPSRHPEPVQYDGDAFHYDTLDFKSLTIFIYLTDVRTRLRAACGDRGDSQEQNVYRDFAHHCE